MLPKFLSPSYKRYKDDTNRLATWLVNEAKKCGLEAEISELKCTTARGKGKGKPRKRIDTKHLVNISQLVLAAETIAASRIRVPAPLLTAAKRSISLRKNVTSWSLGRKDQASDGRHGHFVGILDQVVKTLEWNTPSTGSQTTSTKEAGDPSLVNRFASLVIEEVYEDPNPSLDQGQITQVVVTEDPDDDDDDRFSDSFFEVFCLFHDLATWRAFIREVWQEYADRSLDLMTASVVTDTALKLARDLINNAITNLPAEIRTASRKSGGLASLMYSTACTSRGCDLQPSQHLGLTFNEEMDDVADWTYVKTASLLQSLVPVLESGKVPVYKPGYFGVYDQKADRATMSVADRFKEDKILFLEIAPEFCRVEAVLDLPVRDEITAGFVDFVKRKEVTLWTSFAVQILLDAHHATRHSRIGPFGDLRMCSLRISRVIDDYLKLIKTHPQPAFWPKNADAVVREIRSCIEVFIEQDLLREVSRSAHKELGGDGSPEPPQHLLFSRHPVFCGLFMFQLNLRMQSCGQALVNQWYDVMQVAFLYNLVQQSPGKKVQWPDMEAFLRIHGDKEVFIGNRPKDVIQSLNKLEVATGISSALKLAQVSKAINEDVQRPDGKSTRLLKPTTEAANLFRKRYEKYQDQGSDARALQNSDMRKYLDALLNSSTAFKNTLAHGSENSTLLKSLQYARRTWLKGRIISGIQLLYILKQALHKDEPKLTFDYFGMHRRCIELLRLIQAKEDHKFKQYFTGNYMPDPTMISNLVILIHRIARGNTRDVEALGLLPAAGGSLGSRLVTSCGEIMASYLENNGDAACKMMRTFCTNREVVEFLAQGDSAVQTEKKDNKEGFALLSMEDLLGPLQLESPRAGKTIA